MVIRLRERREEREDEDEEDEKERNCRLHVVSMGEGLFPLFKYLSVGSTGTT